MPIARDTNSLTSASLRALTWNVEWRRSSSADGKALASLISAQAPEIVCLTETDGELALGGGHWIHAHHDHGYPSVRERRKVSLWSRAPWIDVDMVGSDLFPPGRFIAGTTETSVGPLLVIGLCIPWKDAHVRTGRRNSAPWQEHLQYLRGLHLVLSERPSTRAVVCGDFNQTMPRTRAPLAAFEALQGALQRHHEVATVGLTGETGLVIDHVAHTRDFECCDRHALSRLDATGKQLSDHVGICVELKLRV